MNDWNPHDLEPFWESWYIEEFLGEGSYGYVYKIYKEEFHKRYYSALKIIPVPRHKSEEKQLYYEGMDQNTATEYFKDIVEVIYREISLMAELKGRTNIVSFEDHKIVPKKDSAGYYLLIRMELLENIEDYQMKHPFTIEDIVNMGKNLCQALILCNKKNIIHRDIKPGNIFVTEDGDFKLGDFGIARQMQGAQSHLSIKGTYGYMAPEVYFGQTYDTRADIYSLGMVLYYFLNHKRGPFTPLEVTHPNYNQRQEALNRRLQGEKLPLPMFGSECLAKVVLKACEFNANDRYLTPEDFLHALETLPAECITKDTVSLRNEEESQKNETSFDERTIQLSGIALLHDEEIVDDIPDHIPEALLQQPLIEPEVAPTKSNKKKLMFLSVIAVLVIAVVAIVVITSSRSKEQQPTITLTPTTLPTSNPTPTKTPTNTPTPMPLPKEYTVQLDQKELTDFKDVKDIELLTGLSAVDNQLTSIKELEQSVFLTYLNLQKNKISSLDGVEKLIALDYLNLSENKITNLGQLSTLQQLSVLIISDNELKDLRGIEKLTNLTDLYIDGNEKITDIDQLSKLTNLKVLIMGRTGVTDLSALYELKDLEVLDLTDTKISEDTLKQLQEKLPNCRIEQ